MKALTTRKPKEHYQYNEYQYTGNKLVNDIPKPKAKFIQWLNEDIENTDLTDFEFRLLLKLYSMKTSTIINNKALAKKFNKTLRTINDTLENLIKKQYIGITNDKQLIIRRLSKNTIPKPIITAKELLQSDLQKFNEKLKLLKKTSESIGNIDI